MTDCFILLTRPLRVADRTNAWNEAGRFDTYDDALEASIMLEAVETRSVDAQFRAGDALETQVVALSAMPTRERDRSDPRERVATNLANYGGIGKLRALLTGAL